MSRPRISLIVAMAQNRVIGCENRLPWHLPADLQRFRALTWGKPLLMGRKTHESIGRPLPGRDNFVLTSDRAYRAPGCVVVHGIEEALVRVAAMPELMVIGGSSVYAALLPRADRLYLTTLHRDYPGDVFFPAFDLTEWRLSSRERCHDAGDLGCDYSFEVFDRLGCDPQEP